MPGKCSFQDRWLRDINYKDWVRKVVDNKHMARCAFCEKKINIISMGESVLRQHAKTELHKKAERRHKADSRCSVSDFFTSSSGTAGASSQSSASCSVPSTSACEDASSVGSSHKSHQGW